MNNTNNLVINENNKEQQENTVSNHDQNIFQIMTGKTDALQNERPIYAEDDQNDRKMQALAYLSEGTYNTNELIHKAKNDVGLVAKDGKVTKKERKPWLKYRY